MSARDVAVPIVGAVLLSAAIIGPVAFWLWREGEKAAAYERANPRPTLQEQIDEAYALGRRKRFAEVEVLERAAAELGARAARLDCYDAALARLDAAEATLAARGRRAGGAAWLAARRELAACRGVDDDGGRR